MGDARRRRLAERLLWFVLWWGASVAVVLALAWLIRAAIGA